MNAPVLGPNSAFNTPRRERISFPGGLIQQDGIADSIADFVRPESMRCLVVDAAVSGYLAPLIDSVKADLRLEVCGEPATQDIFDLAAKIPTGTQVDFVALGGGSTIDRVKALYLLRATGHVNRVGYGELRRIAESFVSRDRVIAVPTLPGSGAESSRYVVLTEDDRRKRPSRSWMLVPELALLDPTIISNAPEELLIAGAFDAFAHSWETLINREEFSPVLAGLARGNLIAIMRAVEGWIEGIHPIDRRSLQMASAIGGILLSNNRVGLMHTMGEGYARFVQISHPLSIALFFPAVASSYDVAFVENRTGQSLRHVLDVWGKVWSRLGLKAPKPGFDRVDDLVDLILEDTVLVSKEHPGTLDRKTVVRMVKASV